MTGVPHYDKFWKSIISAAGAELQSASTIKGASGIAHPVIAAGVDDNRRRLIIVSAEHDARSAAMAQADIQAVLPSLQVITMRPIAFNAADLAKNLGALFGTSLITMEKLSSLNQQAGAALLKPYIDPIVRGFQAASLNLPAQWMQVVQQLSLITVKTNASDAVPSSDTPMKIEGISLDALISTDPLQPDREFGICPIPLYKLDQSEIELLQDNSDLDGVKNVLSNRGILQFFFPPPDQLALGLIDRLSPRPTELMAQLESAPQLGHPFGESELTDETLPFKQVLGVMTDKGYAVEGEFNLELTDKGKTARATVKFKPRESLVSKIINRISVSFNLKDLLGGS